MTNQDRFGLMILEMVKYRNNLVNFPFNPGEIPGIHVAMRMNINTFRDMFGMEWETWKENYFKKLC